MAKSDLPRSVKVGWRTYRIERWSAQTAAANQRVGETSNLEHVIRVDLSYGQQEAATTLLHEIMHAIYSIWSVERSDKEEARVLAIENGLCTVWRDNPDVMTWIGHHLVQGN